MSSGVTCEMLVNAIKQSLAVEHVWAEDESDGCGAKFQLYVVGSCFDGVKLLERHRMVNEAIKELMPRIHALSQKTWTPAQFEKKKSQVPAHLME